MKLALFGRLTGAACLAVILATLPSVVPTSVAMAEGATTNSAYDCAGGIVPPGSYGSMTISGVCNMPAGNVVIRRGLTIRPGALLDAVTPGDPTTGTPVIPATVYVGGDVTVEAGASLLFGCSPNILCSNPPGISYDVIAGNLNAVRAQGVVVHSAWIGGNVSVLAGGGGPVAATCKAQHPGKPTVKALEPWSLDPSLDFTPVYTDFEDSIIGGSIDITGLTSCWLGTLRNQIGRSATFVANTMGDPDAMEIGSNLVSGDMDCRANLPHVQFGDGGQAPSIVGGRASGQCGFGIKVLNPSPKAHEGPGIPEHLTVSKRALVTRSGSHIATTVASLPSVTTSSGDTLVADLNNFIVTGTGLVGKGTVDPTLPPGQSGEAELTTVYPDGSAKFTAYDTCNCSFGGQTGVVSIRAYGTVTSDGVASGTFLITSGGGPVPGSLSTLAGWGTFTSSGNHPNKAKVIEHLAIT